MRSPFRLLAVASRVEQATNLTAGHDTPSRTRSLLVALLAAVVLSLVAPLQAAEPLKLNIVYILADDLGYGDVGCYNPASKISDWMRRSVARS